MIQESDNHLILIEEYIEGKTLDQQSFSKEQVKDIMHQLCECLDSLHKLNPPIIHRDIKPENIIYHNNKVTLLDFGIARFLDSKKSKDTLILGSVGYAAPEQFGFQQSNPQTDIYALGKLMNYLLNGSLEHQNNISFDLKQVILKATQLDYKNRYNSVKEMDLAIQQKQVIIPAINNDTFKSKMISLAWIVFMFMVQLICNLVKLSKTAHSIKLVVLHLCILVYSFTTTRICFTNISKKYLGLFYTLLSTLYSHL